MYVLRFNFYLWVKFYSTFFQTRYYTLLHPVTKENENWKQNKTEQKHMHLFVSMA